VIRYSGIDNWFTLSTTYSHFPAERKSETMIPFPKVFFLKGILLSLIYIFNLPSFVLKLNLLYSARAIGLTQKVGFAGYITFRASSFSA